MVKITYTNSMHKLKGPGRARQFAHLQRERLLRPDEQRRRRHDHHLDGAARAEDRHP